MSDFALDRVQNRAFTPREQVICAVVIGIEDSLHPVSEHLTARAVAEKYVVGATGMRDSI
jgi:hypothetical protein